MPMPLCEKRSMLIMRVCSKKRVSVTPHIASGSTLPCYPISAAWVLWAMSARMPVR